MNYLECGANGYHGLYFGTILPFTFLLILLPLNVVYGRSPSHLVSYGDKKTPNNEVEQQLMTRDKALDARSTY